ncbi:transposase [Candidatus Tisiphia endosymbiont of Melanophora roralis]|uniref:transposase n=1 Tax=Candidatus Tisiphia endosymbiont of Melanophora roralis TaxID=3066261 RepID=UPI00312C8BA6
MLLAELLYNHFEMKDTRLNTFKGIIKSLMLCRGSKYKNMAEEIEGDKLLDSKIKAVYRFLQEDNINIDDYYKYMKNYIPQGKVVLSIDRTTWELGQEIRNILVLSVSYNKIAMPLIYKIIPYKGACTADDQIAVISKFIGEFGKEKIEGILGDREFDNEKLITYLHNKNINYALRVRRTNRIVNKEGQWIRIDSMKEIKIRNFSTRFYSVPVKFDHIKLASGEYLSIVYSKNMSNGSEIYRKRWDIEAAFKGCKSNGFRMEDTHIKSKVRLENFIKCLFIAYAMAIKIGAIGEQEQPIKMKKTLGCRSYSVLQLGIRSIKQAYSRSKQFFDSLIIKLFKLHFVQPT